MEPSTAGGGLDPGRLQIHATTDVNCALGQAKMMYDYCVVTNGLAMYIDKVRTVEAGLATHRPVALVIRAKGLEGQVEVVHLAERTSSPEPLFGPQQPAAEEGWRGL